MIVEIQPTQSIQCFLLYSQDRDGHTASHVLVLGGSPAKFPTGIITTRNPVLGTYLCVKGVFNLTVYYLHDRWVYRRCLQYLIHCGADLGICSVERETARDIAVRLRKMALLEVIEEACMYDASKWVLSSELSKEHQTFNLRVLGFALWGWICHNNYDRW